MNEYDEDLLFPVQAADHEDFSPEEARFLISLMIWSFSRLNSYYLCPYEWKQKYLLGKHGLSSAMAQYGGYVHRIFEAYLKGELGLFELPLYYEEHYAENVTLPFPPNKFTDLSQKYYDQGLNYFTNFDWDLDDYEILGVEKKIEFEYQGYDFVGFIDLLLRDKSDGKIIILDHKSTILKRLKSGGVSKTDRPHFEEFCKQLLIYSHQVMAEYGEDSVKSLQWNMFRDRSFIAVPWNREAYEEAMQWAVDTIHLIEKDTEWRPSEEFLKAQKEGKWPSFYCMRLCSHRNECQYKNQLIDALKTDERIEYEFM